MPKIKNWGKEQRKPTSIWSNNLTNHSIETLDTGYKYEINLFKGGEFIRTIDKAGNKRKADSKAVKWMKNHPMAGLREGTMIRYESVGATATGEIVETPPFTENVAGDTIRHENRVKVRANPGGELKMYATPKIEDIVEVIK